MYGNEIRIAWAGVRRGRKGGRKGRASESALLAIERRDVVGLARGRLDGRSAVALRVHERGREHKREEPECALRHAGRVPSDQTSETCTLACVTSSNGQPPRRAVSVGS